MLAESARWGDALSTNKPRTVEEDWQGEVDRIDALLAGNGALLIEALKGARLLSRFSPTEHGPREWLHASWNFH